MIDKNGISRWADYDYFEQALEMEKQAILDFLPEDVPECGDCDTCKNPCEQLQKADCG